MAESLDDLNLPTAIIQRLIKESLPKEDSKISVSKDVKLAVSKAASLFILHLTTEALSIANDQKRKTLNGADVISGVMQCGFESFAIPLQEKLNGKLHALQLSIFFFFLNRDYNDFKYKLIS